MLDTIKLQAEKAVRELIEVAALKKGDLLVIGCSSSEIVGEHIGKTRNNRVNCVKERSYEKKCELNRFGNTCKV